MICSLQVPAVCCSHIRCDDLCVRWRPGKPASQKISGRTVGPEKYGLVSLFIMEWTRTEWTMNYVSVSCGCEIFLRQVSQRESNELVSGSEIEHGQPIMTCRPEPSCLVDRPTIDLLQVVELGCNCHNVHLASSDQCVSLVRTSETQAFILDTILRFPD